MTTRHSGYVIALFDDIREDEVADVITALKQIRGVVGIEPVISSPEIQIAEMRADTRWKMRLMKMIQDASKL